MKKGKTTKHQCSISLVANLLSDSWTMLIIHHLLHNNVMRFCELERTLSGISTRTLTIKLKTLEEKAIVEKTEHGYRITQTGEKLRGILDAMEDFGREVTM